jgi:hypothetical protein
MKREKKYMINKQHCLPYSEDVEIYQRLSNLTQYTPFDSLVIAFAAGFILRSEDLPCSTSAALCCLLSTPRHMRVCDVSQRFCIPYAQVSSHCRSSCSGPRAAERINYSPPYIRRTCEYAPPSTSRDSATRPLLYYYCHDVCVLPTLLPNI